MSTATVPQFFPGPSADRIRIDIRSDGSGRQGSSSAVVPRALALRLWAGLPAHARGRGGYVALAYAVDPGLDRPDMFICVAEDDGAPPPWPAWAGGDDADAPVPVWHAVPECTWAPLPRPDAGADGATGPVRAEKRRRAAAAASTAEDMRRRCDTIVEQGGGGGDGPPGRGGDGDAAFLASLDYYTSQRVKLSYLRLNAAGLRERLALVRNKVVESLHRLTRAPASVVQEWSPPAHLPDRLDGPSEDPNALCVPLPDDYDVPDLDGDASALALLFTG